MSITIHTYAKFGTRVGEQYPLISNCSDIDLIVDESPRSQYCQTLKRVYVKICIE
jgi:hypothetical protein